MIIALQKIDRYSSYVPVASTITNVTDIALKIFIKLLSSETIENNSYLNYLNEKSIVQCLVLLVPFLGNLVFFIFEEIHSNTNQQANNQSLSEEIPPKNQLSQLDQIAEDYANGKLNYKEAKDLGNPEIFNHPRFMLFALQMGQAVCEYDRWQDIGDKLWKDPQFISSIIRLRIPLHRIHARIDPSCFNNRELMLAIANADKENIFYIGYELRKDPQFYIDLLRGKFEFSKDSIEKFLGYIDLDLLKNDEIKYLLLSGEHNIVSILGKSCRRDAELFFDDKSLLEKYIRNVASDFKYISSRLRADIDFIKKALQFEFNYLYGASVFDSINKTELINQNKWSPELLSELISINHRVILYSDFNERSALWKQAIILNPWLYTQSNEFVKTNYEVSLFAVQNNKRLFPYVSKDCPGYGTIRLWAEREVTP